MLHGRARDEVEAGIETVSREAGLARYPRQVLFSARCFKQRGARYASVGAVEAAHG